MEGEVNEANNETPRTRRDLMADAVGSLQALVRAVLPADRLDEITKRPMRLVLDDETGTLTIGVKRGDGEKYECVDVLVVDNGGPDCGRSLADVLAARGATRH